MKKFIITTACTLVLSLFGSLGANQDALNIKDKLSKELNTEAVEQPVEETVEEATKDAVTELTEEVNALPTENDTNTTSANDVVNKIDKTTDVVKDTTTEQKEETPSKSATVKDTKKSQTTSAPKAENNNKTNDYVQPVNREVVKDTVLNSNNVKKIVYDSKRNCYTLNGEVIAYGNMDLSELGSIEDILAKFNDSGFKVETTNNNNINNNSSQKENTNNTPKESTKTTPAPSNNNHTQNDSGLSSYANQVLQLVNQERAKAGLSAFTTNSTLTAAANKRAQETKQSFSHTRPNGTSFSTVFKEFGISYRTSGENIAYGQRSPEEVVNGWMNSPGHRANILNPSFNKIGIGVYESNGTIYWSQLFTN
jgi:uncharacterized protein YkwD